jgi:hypothetical protein
MKQHPPSSDDDDVTVFKHRILLCLVLLKTLIPTQQDPNWDNLSAPTDVWKKISIKYINTIIWKICILSYMFYACVVQNQ